MNDDRETLNPAVCRPDRSPDRNRGVEELDSSRAGIGPVEPERSKERANVPILQRVPQDQRELARLRHGKVNDKYGFHDGDKYGEMTVICTLLWFIFFSAEAGPPVGFRTGGGSIMKERNKSKTTLARKADTMAYLCVPSRQLCVPAPLRRV